VAGIRARGRSTTSTRCGRRARRGGLGVVTGVVLFATATLAGCGDGGGGPPTLTWYTNPDNGGQEALAEKCTEAADGRYRIEISVLPAEATDQREQLVRRLAANDSTIDLMSLDVVFVPEFAAAGFLRPFTDAEAERLTRGVLDGPLETTRWEGRTVTAPFWANTQLLWYRRSVAEEVGLDVAPDDLTWDQVIDAAERTGTQVDVTGSRYEGYMVWINSLVASAGGSVLEDPAAGRDAVPTLDSPAGQAAARVIERVGTSGVANPGISTAIEENARAGFQSDDGGFMLNWPYVYGAARTAVEDGSLDQSVFEDIGWRRIPRVDAERPSAPPLGGINLGIGAFSDDQDMAVDAAGCITSVESQVEYMLGEGNSGARSEVFDDPEIREAFPMADLIRDSINEAVPRPRTAYYPDISEATVRQFHPPASVDPRTTPRDADELITAVLDDEQLL
jgi:multiple sugar transport system substrate-binding protein